MSNIFKHIRYLSVGQYVYALHYYVFFNQRYMTS